MNLTGQPGRPESTFCPACGKPNACARATDPVATKCWCQSVTLPPEALDRLREVVPGSACLCRDCLEREIAATSSS